MQHSSRISVWFFFAASFFLSAYLLFLLQPLAGKVLLPVYGGAPSVWSACLLFFQTLLFCGYVYAHLLVSRLKARRQVAVHLTFVAAALLTLPITTSFKSSFSSLPPEVEILLLLLINTGPVFFVLSATNSVLQSWYARCGGEPYRFYSISNAGSLLALLSYPFLIEPSLSLAAQGRLWSAGFALFVAAIVVVAVVFVRRAASSPGLALDASGGGADPATVLRWIALAALPSALLVAVTNRITLNVAASPFLWVTPLALYLMTFILVFWSASFFRVEAIAPFWILAVLGAAFALLAGGAASLRMQLALMLACLTIGALICHSALAASRPAANRLTSYYLCITAGGAVGGLFSAALAPLIFEDYFELPLIILCISLLLPFAVGRAGGEKERVTSRRLLWLSLGFGAVAMSMVMWAISGGFETGERLVHRTRGFFGVARITETSKARYLAIGEIQHGLQLKDPSLRDLPVAYFGPESGVGLVLSRHKNGSPRRIAVIGLGVGTLAAYGRPGDAMEFIELNPDVARLAEKYFTYLASSLARVSVKTGDGRLEIGREEGLFDIIVLDAFSSDAIPTHLLTKQAFQLYLSKLQSDGILSVNVTNRHLDIARVVQASADSLGMTLKIVETESEPKKGLNRARWALMVRQSQTLAPVLDGVAPGPRVGEPVEWTDDYSALWSVVK